MDYYMTGNDLLDGMMGKAKIVLYPDLYKYKDIEELLAPHGAVFLLYEFEKRVGHWTLVFKQGDTIEFFDSYNYKPDYEFEFIPDNFRIINNMLYPQLTKMLYDSGKEIHYNNYKLQRESSDIATCGRHVLTRLWFKDLNIDEYYKMMKYLCNKTKLTPDEIVYYLTDQYDSTKASKARGGFL